jgi:hypothetical protein
LSNVNLALEEIMTIESNTKYKTRSGSIIRIESFRLLSSGRVYKTNDNHLYGQNGVSLHADPENDIVEEA